MKLKIDTFNKTIQIEESVNLKELFDDLELMFPNGEWKKYTLTEYLFNEFMVWKDPIRFDKEITQPITPFTPPWEITCESSNQVSGVYCVEIK